LSLDELLLAVTLLVDTQLVLETQVALVLFLVLVIVILIKIASLGLLNLALPLGLNREHLAFRVLREHGHHDVVEFDGIVQKLLAVPLRVVNDEGGLSNLTQIVVEDVLLQDLSVLLVPLIVRRGHVPDRVEDLGQQLQA
jgi:hypothetical protein